MNTEATIGLKITSFVFPIIGMFLYLYFDMDYPIKSKKCLDYALVGLIVKIILMFVLKVSIFDVFDQVVHNIVTIKI